MLLWRHDGAARWDRSIHDAHQIAAATSRNVQLYSGLSNDGLVTKLLRAIEGGPIRRDGNSARGIIAKERGR